MHDPNIDGFNGWGCKEKLYKVKFMVDAILEEAPTYAGEEDWLHETNKKKIWKELKK